MKSIWFIVAVILFLAGLLLLSGTPTGEALVATWKVFNDSPAPTIDEPEDYYHSRRGYRPNFGGKYPVYPVRPRPDPGGYRREGPDYSDPALRRSYGGSTGVGEADQGDRGYSSQGRDFGQGKDRK